MGPLSFMRSVFDRNIVLRHIPVNGNADSPYSDSESVIRQVLL